MPKKNNPGCNCCEEGTGLCDGICDSGGAPALVSLSVSGITGTCGTPNNCCTHMNNTWTLATGFISGNCTLDNVTPGCGGTSNGNRFDGRLWDTGSVYKLAIRIAIAYPLIGASCGFGATYSKTWPNTSKIGCTAWSNEVLTYDANALSTFFINDYDLGGCTNKSGLTVKVTAI